MNGARLSTEGRMADYFLVHDPTFLDDRARPALAAAWHQRSFEPCRGLCAELAPAALDYTRRYHVSLEATLVGEVVHGLAFDRPCWRALVGEVLLFAALDIPEFPTNAETLFQLLAPGASEGTDRARAAPIVQALRGSRYLTFGRGVYRPEHAGLNSVADVARLADYLGQLAPETWSVNDLAGLAGVAEEDRAEELELVREWFPELTGLYRRCRDEGRAIVIEGIY
jgi:hypothetical protein